MNWEDTLGSWAKGPGTTEQDRCDNTERAVKRAISNHARLSALPISVFTQGSYPARTNVRQDSDVDVCVRLNDTFFYDLSFSQSQNVAEYDFGPASISFADFRNLVGEALEDEFGPSGVTRGNKAFDVHENSYRIDADVLAAFEHRRYTGPTSYISGIEFESDSGKRIINWPDHMYENGVAKNNRTARVYKRVIRILKRLRNAMQAADVHAADDVASSLIEGLVWNTPDEHFAADSYSDIVRAVLAHTFNNTINQSDCNDWGEVNELKYLMRDASQPWTRAQAHDFLGAAWDYIGYK